MHGAVFRAAVCGLFLVAATTQAAQAVTVGGISIDSEVLGGGLGSGGATIFEYRYAIVNGSVAGSGPSLNEFRLPFFDSFSDSIAFGLTTPAFWLASFEARNAGNWQYDPILDPAADAYGVPADAFIAPDFVLRFFVDPKAESKAAEGLRAAQSRLAAAQTNLANQQIAFDQAAAALAAQQINVNAAQQQVNTARLEVLRLNSAVLEQAGKVGEVQDIADIACLVPLNPACPAALIAVEVEKDKLEDLQADLDVANAVLLAAGSLLSVQETLLAVRQREFDTAQQELEDAQSELAAAEIALAAAEAAVAAAPEAAVDPGESLSGFGFRSFFEPGEIPFLVVSSGGDLIIDPLGPRTANFPEAVASAVFEPSTGVMLAVGLVALGFTRCHRRSSIGSGVA